MSSKAIANPFRSLHKMRGRSLEELRERGAQAVSAYRELLSFGAQLPDAEEFQKLLDPKPFGTIPLTDEGVSRLFYLNADRRFFPSVNGNPGANFTETCGREAAQTIIEKADEIVAGRFDLLGYKGLFVGQEVDWHLEPVSGFRSPARHWKDFDELDMSETGDKKIVWELNRHQHFFTLGAAYRISGNEEYARVFSRHLDSWIDQNPPAIGVNWVSSLEVAFRSMSWLWALNLFRGSAHLTNELFIRAVRSLYAHGRHIEKYLSKYYSPNTHLTGEALGLYYLGTQLPFLAVSRRWRELGEEILLDEAGKQFHTDGVYFEQSTWYHRYSVDFYLHFLALRERLGFARLDVRKTAMDARIAAACDHLMHLTRPDGSTPLIGDDDGGRMLPVSSAASDDLRETLAAGAAHYGRADWKFVAGDAVEHVFWLFGANAAELYAGLTPEVPARTSESFDKGGYYTMRDGWSETDDLAVIDCGELGALSAAHGHADALSIDLSLHGRRLLVDPGTFTYHGDREMREFFRSSAGHNTLTVDGRSSSEAAGKFSWRSRAVVDPPEWIAEERFDYFKGSVAHADGPVHERSVLYLKGDYFVIRDLVRTEGEHEFALHFHYPADRDPNIDDRGAAARDEGHGLFVFGDGGELVKEAGWVSTDFGRVDKAPVCRYRTRGKGTQEFYTFILPIEPSDAQPAVTEVSLSGGRAFVIRYLGYTDLLIAGNGDTKLRTEVISTDFEWSWARLAAGENTPQEGVAINGRRLSLALGPIVRREWVKRFVTFRTLGSQINVKTDTGRSTVFLRGL